MTEAAVDLLLWILPPVLGAIIGFVTNAVAIKMLFRPHRAWKIFGIKVPLTPGIIPRQRYQLAESIGSMVSGELLTEETLLSQIRSEKFSSGLEQAISRFTDGIFDRTVGSLRETVGGEDQLDLLPLVEDLLRGFLRSDGIKRLIHLVIHSGLHALTDRDIKELFKNDEQKERFIDWIYGLIRNPETGNRLLARAGDWLEEKGSDAAQVGDYIPAESREWLTGITDVLYEPFFGFVLDWLQSGSMRMQLQNRGRELLRNILEKLNTFQRFLVAATQYDKTLDEKMPEIVDDVIKSMKEAVADEETRKTMLDTVVASIDELRARTIGEVNESYGLPGKVKTVFEALQRTISEDPAGDSLKTVLRNILTQLENRSLESFLEHAFTVSDAADYLTDLVSSSVESSADAISRSAMEQISDIIDRKGNAKIGELLGIGDSGKAKIDSRLAQIALDALAKQIPGILDTLDVHEMVVSKINGLAVEDVEGLLLRVIHRHLKWINVFGAILGFFIGMMQVLTRLF